jgi:hypothetical protein
MPVLQFIRHGGLHIRRQRSCNRIIDGVEIMLGNQITQSSTRFTAGAEADFRVRTFTPADRADVFHLYHHGSLADHQNPTCNAPDLADIESSYLRRPQDHFWVAEARGEVIGTIAIAEDAERVMNLRRLRVSPFWQLDNRVVVSLLRTAIIHSRSYGCLKLLFHTSLNRARAMELLDGLGLQISRVRYQDGQHLIELYPDLYTDSYGGTSPDSSIVPRA